MSTLLAWQVHIWHSSILICVRGSPDPRSVIELATVVKGYLAQPRRCVTVDLSSVAGDREAARTAAALMTGHHAVISGMGVMLCDQDPGTDRNGRDGGPGESISWLLARAREAIWALPPSSTSLSEQLLSVRGAARRSRDLVTAACLAWDLSHLVGAAALVVSELVSHTTSHSSTTMTLVAMLHEDVVYLGVRGGAGRGSGAADTAVDDLTVLLINSTADHWGILSDDDGTLIWAALPASPGHPHPRRPLSM